jgi:Carboxypeptidase regulatory-like domain
MAVVPMSDDTGALPPAPEFINMQAMVTIGPSSASALGVYVPLSQLQLAGAAVNGFSVHFYGVLDPGGTTVPVRFSYVFRIPLTDSGVASIPLNLPSQFNPANWDSGVILQAISGAATQPTAAISKAGAQVVDPATKTVAIALSADSHSITTQLQAAAAIQAGITAVALKTGALTTKDEAVRLLQLQPAPAGRPAVQPAVKFDPWSPLPVAAGNQCYPDDITDADAATAAAQQLVCQLTNETQTETIPSSFQNALAGDIILSPAPVGDGDLIAAMFRALTPPQHHGHSGIMTLNFYEITHCTSSPERLKANVNKDSAGIPTSLNGNMLQYGWPGSLTQSIDDATNSCSFKDPSGASYSMVSFNTSPQGDGFEIIPPLVIKPLPDNEAAARPTLRKIADTARSKGARYDANGNLTQKGGCYYSFYAYTKPELSTGFADPAGADAGWAQGLSPAVCSSFVWLSAKANNIPLVGNSKFETLAEFSASAVAGGAQVGSATLDGLIYYPQAERQQGGQALYQMFMDQALSQEDGLGTLPGINQAIAGPIADQLLNCFASGNPNLVGSNAWQNPGDGNAVSPDNIIWWNPPYYGYAEPLQYLPRHTEQYTVSRWTKVITWGSIKGVVRANGTPVPNAHVWVYIPGGETYTAADGSYTLNHVPIGPYQLKAQTVITRNGVSAEYTNGNAGQPVTLTAANSNIVQDLVLQGLPQNYRRADITYSVSCDHGDANPFNTHGVQTAGPFSQSTYVNPGQVTSGLSYTYDYAGGGYFHVTWNFTVALLNDLSIEVTLVGNMYDDGGGGSEANYTVGPFNVPVGSSCGGWMTLEHSNGYHNGPATFNFTVANNQQTG